MGLGDWTHIGPLMHSFMSPNKVNLVFFTFRESEKNLKMTQWMNFS
jgi:hypothetical protein